MTSNPKLKISHKNVEISKTLNFDGNGDEFTETIYLRPNGTHTTQIAFTGKRRADYDVEELSDAKGSVKEEFFRQNYARQEVERVVIAKLRTAASVQIQECADQEIGGFTRYGDCPILDYFFMLEDKIKYLESLLSPEGWHKHEIISHLHRKEQIREIDVSAMQGRLQQLREENAEHRRQISEIAGQRDDFSRKVVALEARLEVAEASSPRFAISSGRAMADF